MEFCCWTSCDAKIPLHSIKLANVRKLHHQTFTARSLSHGVGCAMSNQSKWCWIVRPAGIRRTTCSVVLVTCAKSLITLWWMTMIESPSKGLRDINCPNESGKCARSSSPSFCRSRKPALPCKTHLVRQSMKYSGRMRCCSTKLTVWKQLSCSRTTAIESGLIHYIEQSTQWRQSCVSTTRRPPNLLFTPTASSLSLEVNSFSSNRRHSMRITQKPTAMHVESTTSRIMS